MCVSLSDFFEVFLVLWNLQGGCGGGLSLDKCPKDKPLILVRGLTRDSPPPHSPPGCMKVGASLCAELCSWREPPKGGGCEDGRPHGSALRRPAGGSGGGRAKGGLRLARLVRLGHRFSCHQGVEIFPHPNRLVDLKMAW